MKNRTTYIAGIIGALIGVIIGYSIFLPQKAIAPLHDSVDMNGHAMDHPSIEVTTDTPIPTVAIEALPDTKDGYNVHITTENFTFTPERVNETPIPNEGHAHIFVNGIKISRVYGEWFYLPSSHFVSGENIIEVTLNANDHSDWLYNGEHISAQVTVTK